MVAGRSLVRRVWFVTLRLQLSCHYLKRVSWRQSIGTTDRACDAEQQCIVIKHSCVSHAEVRYRMASRSVTVGLDSSYCPVRRDVFTYLVTRLACWPLVPKIAGSLPTEAVGFFRLEKSTACLPTEGSKIICPMSQLWGM
jgi:hypothetical protein